ncbi:ABC transporter ATP-binding protein [Butyrivibrio sp. AE2005]|uniref:ABC transporter ATP-binding protein n=1 Tax=Butyrivibrio sp. AE2005 TaxID=1496722 RepID=UPI00047B2A9A|nr:ABC transporter ATP-binding protein [Butyrivibrio sp. AE2005]
MIKIDGLKKKYKDFELDISMDIKEGTVTGLIGKNGAGKSTAIKAILGLIHPDAGSIKVMGDVPGKNMENIGAAFSDSGMSMLYNINDISCIMHAMYDEFEEDKFKELCQKMELPFDKLLKDFSSGMKAKLKVLLTISHKAKLLVLDEPTTGLDVLARNEVMDMLRQYLEEDATRSILISSHISTDLEGLCDDIYMIDNGKIILHEDTDVLLGQYGVLKMSEKEFEELDKQYVTVSRKDSLSVTCLTNEKQYYIDNYPNIAVENSRIDDIIMLTLGGN